MNSLTDVCASVQKNVGFGV